MDIDQDNLLTENAIRSRASHQH